MEKEHVLLGIDASRALHANVRELYSLLYRLGYYDFSHYESAGLRGVRFSKKSTKYFHLRLEVYIGDTSYRAWYRVPLSFLWLPTNKVRSLAKDIVYKRRKAKAKAQEEAVERGKAAEHQRKVELLKSLKAELGEP